MNERQRQAWIHRALHFQNVVTDWRHGEYAKLPDSNLNPTAWQEGSQLIAATERWMWRSNKYGQYEVWISLVAQALEWPVPPNTAARLHGYRIQAIKVIRTATDLGLVSSKWIIDELTNQLDPQHRSTLIVPNEDQNRCNQILESLEELYMIW